MNSKLTSDGHDYNLRINWEKRLTLEIPFIINTLKEVDYPITTILDVGCGPGWHAKKLIEAGYIVTGVDLGEAMIEEAKKLLPSTTFIIGDFMDRSLLYNHKFDAAISLGNSVGLIAQNYGYKEVIIRFKELLKDKALLIFQVLNFEKERNTWSKPKTLIVEDEGEYIFLKRFQTTSNYVQPELITLYRKKGNSEWVIKTLEKASIPRISQQELKTILEEEGFKSNFYGDYHRNPFDPKNSTDMICVATLG